MQGDTFTSPTADGASTAAGATFALPLLRIDSAEPGWGYKQRLGFRYWPMDASGTYTIVARDVQRGLEMPAVTVDVK